MAILNSLELEAGGFDDLLQQRSTFAIERFGLCVTPEQTVSTFNTAISFMVNMVSASDTIGAGVIELTHSEYIFSSGISLPSWIKIRSRKPVRLDFSSVSTGSLIRINNELFPRNAVPPGPNAANISPVLDGTGGTIHIVGPGRSVNVIAVDIGGTISGPDQTDTRDVCLSNVVISSTRHGIMFKPVDCYLFSAYRVRIEGVQQSVGIVGPSQSNSGERMSFMDCTFASADANGYTPTALYHDCDAIDINYINCSFDFCMGRVAYFTNNARYSKISYSNCHFEHSNDDGLIERFGGDVNNLLVTITDCKIFPSTSSQAVASGARPDGLTTSYTSMFKGNFALKVNGFQIGGFNKRYRNASSGLYLCDSGVNILEWASVVFNDWADVHVSRSTLNNYNYNFTTLNSGADLKGTPQPGWRMYDTFNGSLTPSVDTDFGFDGSEASVKITGFDISSNFFSMVSDPLNIATNQIIKIIPVVYGGASTGTCQFFYGITFYRPSPKKCFNIINITSNGSGPREVVVETNVSHSLTNRDYVNISGVDQVEYNGDFTIEIIDPTRFKYITNGSPTSPATGTGMRVVTEPLAQLSVIGNQSSSMSSIYGDTDFPGHTGNRLWWARSEQVYTFRAPVGSSAVRVSVGVSNLALNDVIWIGQCGIEIL